MARPLPHLFGHVRSEGRKKTDDGREGQAQGVPSGGGLPQGVPVLAGQVVELHDRADGRVKVETDADVLGHLADGLVRFLDHLGGGLPRSPGVRRRRGRRREERRDSQGRESRRG